MKMLNIVVRNCRLRGAQLRAMVAFPRTAVVSLIVYAEFHSAQAMREVLPQSLGPGCTFLYESIARKCASPSLTTRILRLFCRSALLR